MTTTILFAILLGFLFGFILQKVGASNPQKIIGMLRLSDLHLMRAILLGIGTSSLILFALLALGLVDSAHLSVKASYVGVIIGGAILGLGWAMSGFCPGTGVVAAGAGRKDALIFIIGGLLGALAYTISYASLKSTFLFDKLGSKATLVETGNDKFTALMPAVSPLLVAGGIGALFILIAIFLPKSILKD